MICQDLITQLERAAAHNLIMYTVLTASETKVRFLDKHTPLVHKIRLKRYIETTYKYQAWISNDEQSLTIFHAVYPSQHIHNPT